MQRVKFSIHLLTDLTVLFVDPKNNTCVRSAISIVGWGRVSFKTLPKDDYALAKEYHALTKECLTLANVSAATITIITRHSTARSAQEISRQQGKHWQTTGKKHNCEVFRISLK